MSETIEILKLFGAAIVILCFIYFILIRAISTKNYIRKSFFIFIAGFIIVLFFIGGIIYDIKRDVFELVKNNISYYSFIIVAVTLMIMVSLIYFIKGYKRKQRFKNAFKNPKSAPIIKDKKEFVYIIFKYNGNFILEKETEKENIYYRGTTLKFGYNDFFHDEIIKKYIIDNKLKIVSYKYIGKATKVLKKDNVYYCYNIVLSDVSNFKDKYENIDSYELLNSQLHDDDKKIIFTSVVNDEFDIKL